MNRNLKKDLNAHLTALSEFCEQNEITHFILVSTNPKINEAFRSVYGRVDHIHSMLIECIVCDPVFKQLVCSALMSTENIQDFVNE